MMKLTPLVKSMGTIAFCLYSSCFALNSWAAQDDDGDGIANEHDNCQQVANAGQWDKDQDGLGNECDPDIDGDGVSNADEDAAGTKTWDQNSFPGQTLINDRDQDGFANAFDNCPDDFNQGQWDKDKDGLGNECDLDIDGDGVSNVDEEAAGTKVWDPNHSRQSRPLKIETATALRMNKITVPI